MSFSVFPLKHFTRFITRSCFTCTVLAVQLSWLGQAELFVLFCYFSLGSSSPFTVWFIDLLLSGNELLTPLIHNEVGFLNRPTIFLLLLLFPSGAPHSLVLFNAFDFTCTVPIVLCSFLGRAGIFVLLSFFSAFYLQVLLRLVLNIFSSLHPREARFARTFLLPS